MANRSLAFEPLILEYFAGTTAPASASKSCEFNILHNCNARIMQVRRAQITRKVLIF